MPVLLGGRISVRCVSTSRIAAVGATHCHAGRGRSGWVSAGLLVCLLLLVRLLAVLPSCPLRSCVRSISCGSWGSGLGTWCSTLSLALVVHAGGLVRLHAGRSSSTATVAWRVAVAAVGTSGTSSSVAAASTSSSVTASSVEALLASTGLAACRLCSRSAVVDRSGCSGLGVLATRCRETWGATCSR